MKNKFKLMKGNPRLEDAKCLDTFKTLGEALKRMRHLREENDTDIYYIAENK